MGTADPVALGVGAVLKQAPLSGALGDLSGGVFAKREARG